MKNALHLINQNSILRLMAVFLCSMLFTTGQLMAAPVQNYGDIQINSLKIIPENPQGNDSVYLVVEATLTSSGCGILDYNVTLGADGTILVKANYWQGNALAICYSTDSLFIGNFDEGNYTLNFNQSASVNFTVGSETYPDCKADFTVLSTDCSITEQSDCTTGITHFFDNSAGDAVQWKWSFGDGQYSDEQNPKHVYANNGSYQVCLEIMTGDGCASKVCKTVMVYYGSNTCNYRGTVYDYTGLDGCGYIIELDNGIKLEPVKFLNQIELRDSMRVKLSYSLVRVATTCMVGQTAVITCIEEIDAWPCVANFEIEKNELVNTPNAYNFINKSQGSNLKYGWDFGDGTTSTEANPMHIYSDTGIYLVCLKIFNETGCEDQVCKRLIVGETWPDCKAQFRYQYIPCDSLPIDYCPGYFVQFTDKSYGENLLYHWDFGDGNASYEQNPSHFYENAGFYVVTLKIESATDFRYCGDKIARQIRVGPTDSLCKAYFEYEALSLYHYKFYDLSYGYSGNTAGVSWDFGDGTSGYGKVVEHVYKEAGTYQVCVTSTNADGCTSRYCKTIVINDSNDCLTTFNYTYLPCECMSCACLQFIPRTNNEVVKWFWDFGDGSYSHEPEPYHTYFSPVNRKYTVCLTTVTSTGCKSHYCRDVWIYNGGHEVPWIPVIGGNENHIIIVPENVDVPELNYGDYIGLFFKDINGNDVCGGMLEWKGEVGTITAWGATSYTDTPDIAMKNGFYPGEIFGYKIWKHATNRIIEIAAAKYEVDELVTDSGEYRDDGLSKLVALNSCNSQAIRLHRGWNLVSLNVEPLNNKMKDIFGNNQYVLVKDAAGNIRYFPPAGIMDGEWNSLEGYKIKVWSNTGITVCGTKIDPQTSIPLHGGAYPDFLPYYYTFQYPIEYALAEINDDIRYVQSLEYLDGTGKVMALNYIPAYGINQIGNMKPGLAYKLSLVTTLKSFTYPYPWIDGPVENTSGDSINRNTTTNQHNASFDESNGNRILVIPGDVIALNEGDEINIYTQDNFYAGSWLYNGESNTAVTLWDNPDMPDYSEFEISIVNSSRKEVARYSVDVNEDVYVDGDILELKQANITSVGNFAGDRTINLYPNPANSMLWFELPAKDHSGEINIQVYDLGGRKVVEQTSTLDGHVIELNVDNLSKGAYILQIRSLNNTYNTKFVKR